jgi:copper chaperone NosL
MRFFTLFILTVMLFVSGCSRNPPMTSAHLLPAFQTVPSNDAILLQQGDNRTSCAVCGTHLPSFYKTNHAATLKNGRQKQYCSLHCLVYDNEVNKTDLYDLKVVDVTTLKFIPAQSAYYVVGSDCPGTMSPISKYAFAKRSDADAFAKAYGGLVMNFYDAYTVAYEDFVCE